MFRFMCGADSLETITYFVETLLGALVHLRKNPVVRWHDKFDHFGTGQGQNNNLKFWIYVR